MAQKLFIDANTLLVDSLALARQIYESNFSPNLLIGIWRGGTPPGIAIHEFLTLKGLDLEHTVIKVQSYKGIELRSEVKIDRLDHLISMIRTGDKILLVDDIFDTGHTLAGVIQTIQKQAQEKNPRIKMATIYYKPSQNKTNMVPDFYLKIVDQWVVFPHELKDLTKEEIRKKGEKIYRIIYK